MNEVKKARAIIIENDKQVLVPEYNGCLMFPGGKLNEGEDSYSAVIREVKEETGIILDGGRKLFNIYSDNLNYPEVNGSITPNKLVETDFFLFRLFSIELGKSELTQREKMGGFVIHKIRLDDLTHMISNYETDNERWPYFKKEMQIAIKGLESHFSDKRRLND